MSRCLRIQLLRDKETHGTSRESGDVSFVSSVPTTGCRSLETSRHMFRETHVPVSQSSFPRPPRAAQPSRSNAHIRRYPRLVSSVFMMSAYARSSSRPCSLTFIASLRQLPSLSTTSSSPADSPRVVGCFFTGEPRHARRPPACTFPGHSAGRFPSPRAAPASCARWPA